jgi:hypothetical protein
LEEEYFEWFVKHNYEYKGLVNLRKEKLNKITYETEV